jgi:exoribonuclease R
MKSMEELEFVRTKDFNLIPVYLFNQFKDLKADPKDLYFWGSTAANNPLTLLYVAVNKQHKIKGFMWAILDVLERVVHVKALTIDKDYQGGNIIAKAKDKLEEEIRQYNKKADGSLKINNKIKFYTTRSGAFEKAGKELGWKMSKQAIMEIDLE